MELNSRAYFLPLLLTCSSHCIFCKQLGCCENYDRDLTDIERALQRAHSGEYKRVIFPANFWDYPKQDELLALCSNYDLAPEVLTPLTQFKSLSSLKINQVKKIWYFNQMQLKLFLESNEEVPPGDFLCIPNRSKNLINVLNTASKTIKENLYFYFPFIQTIKDPFLSCQDIEKLNKKLKQRSVDISLRPYPGLDIWDLRADRDLCFEPMQTASWRTSAVHQQKIEISVIIPSFNNKEYLKNVIKHLENQSLNKSKYEIIIVDDGSTDGTESEIRSSMSSWQQTLNLIYVYFPRKKPRKMGDANFRAGISRNLGVKFASGSILLFLDSDVLVPNLFLQSTLDMHQKYDLVQCIRLDLKEESSHSETCYNEIIETRDTTAFEGEYWQTFHQAKNWSDLPDYWKYTCSYGLSISNETFKSLGWFKRNFIFYGFEDTEFGYRAYRAGLKFGINKTITYHLFHQPQRSEFKKLKTLRQSLLATTAQIFYRNNLSSEVYNSFYFYLNREVSWARNLFSCFCGYFENLWRPNLETIPSQPLIYDLSRYVEGGAQFLEMQKATFWHQRESKSSIPSIIIIDREASWNSRRDLEYFLEKYPKTQIVFIPSKHFLNFKVWMRHLKEHENKYIYFPAKKHNYDPFMNLDELTNWIRIENPLETFKLTDWQQPTWVTLEKRRFLTNPNLNFYWKFWPKLEGPEFIKRIVLSIINNPLGRRIFLLLLWPAKFLEEGPEKYLKLLHARNSWRPSVYFGRLQGFSQRIYGEALRIWSFRWKIKVAWIRFKSHAWFFRNPGVYLREHLPRPIFKIAVFPWLKLFYFLRFQIRKQLNQTKVKRILK